MNVGFAAAVIATFDGIVEETVNRVTVVLVILCGVDPALCSDGVCAARAIVEGKYLNLVA